MARPGTARALPRCERRPSSRLLPRFGYGATGLAERCPDRLEDRREHVLRVGPLDEAYVQVQPGGERELLEEARCDVGREPADALVREIDVRDEAGLCVA